VLFDLILTLKSSEKVYKFDHIVEYRSVARQRPRNKQRDNDHSYVRALLIRNSIGAVARQRLARNNGSTVGSGV
jgi:hypothetical protein